MGVELGEDTFDVTAVEVHGADRDRLYNAFAAENTTKPADVEW